MKKLFVLLSFVLSLGVFAIDLEPEQKAVLDKQVEIAKGWGKDKVIVDAVKAINTSGNADYKDMTQDKWKELPILDPKVRNLSKNAVAEFLKSKKGDAVTEAFVSAADGTKVALLNKTSNWSHKGKPKHDDPMAGKTWQGGIELDESTGTQQIQIAVPVMDGDKAIGSLVVGYSVSKLK